jgi:hypothetical protein
MKLPFPFPESYRGKIVKYQDVHHRYYGIIENSNSNTIIWFRSTNKYYHVPARVTYDAYENEVSRYEILA